MIGIFKSNSIRSRLLTSFLALTLLIILLAVVSVYLLQRSRRMTAIRQDVFELQVLTLQLIKNDNDFLDFETIHDQYYLTHESPYLKHHAVLVDSILSKTQRIPIRNYQNERLIDQSLVDIIVSMKQYNDKFRQLDSLQMTRGFKNYGIEGSMRQNAHELEKFWATRSPQSMILLLTLRRHEKDFFLRKDLHYLQLFNETSARIMNEPMDEGSQMKLIQYMDHFNHLVQLDSLIGLESGKGIRKELNDLSSKLNDDYTSLATYSDHLATAVVNQAVLFYGIIITAVILLSIISGIWFSKRISAPIVRLSNFIKHSLYSSRYKKFPIKTLNPNSATEVRELAESFNQLMDQIDAQLIELESKSQLVKKKNLTLKRVNHELDNFLYSVAHDIRAPLSSLLGLINIIRYENKQPEVASYLEMMEGSINRLEHFIKQVSGYARNKNVISRSERVDLTKLIQEILDDHKFIDGASRIRKEVKLHHVQPLFTDGMRLRILLTNLISNAIRYADFTKEDPFLKITGVVNESEVMITVSDNGQGIDRKDQARIFDMFFRGNQKSKGSGLGLFIFKKTLVKLKGKVHVTSELHVGTSFVVSIPNLVPADSVSIKLEEVSQ